MAAIQVNPTASFAEQVAANIRAEAAVRGLHQKDLAEAIGVAQSNVSLRWRGRVPWKLDDIEAIAQLFGISPVELCALRPRMPAYTGGYPASPLAA